MEAGAVVAQHNDSARSDWDISYPAGALLSWRYATGEGGTEWYPAIEDAVRALTAWADREGREVRRDDARWELGLTADGCYPSGASVVAVAAYEAPS